MFMRHLTKCGGCDLLWPLQPKSVRLPASRCGGTRFRMKIRTGRTKPGNRIQGHFQGQARQLTSSAIGRAILESVFKFTQDKKCYGVVAFIVAALFIGKIMLDIIYIGIVVVFFAAFALYAIGCEKL